MQLNVTVRALGLCVCVCVCACVCAGLVIQASSPEQPEQGIVHRSRGTARRSSGLRAPPDEPHLTQALSDRTGMCKNGKMWPRFDRSGSGRVWNVLRF